MYLYDAEIEEVDCSARDIRGYLATLQPEDVAGITYSSFSCLLARTLTWKLGPQTKLRLGTYTVVIEGEVLKLPEEVREIAHTFDELYVTFTKTYGRHASVTREQVEKHIPELKQKQGE